MREDKCFTSGCEDECEGFSAYCTAHKPVLVRDNEPTGRKQAKCAGCGELFTTVRTFDGHQSMVNGKVVCKDPRTMFDGQHRRKLVLTTRGWAKNPELAGFNTFARQDRKRETGR